MSIQDYESLRRLRSDLLLPPYQELPKSARRRLRRLATRQELIARASAIILRHEGPVEWAGIRKRKYWNVMRNLKGQK